MRFLQAWKATLVLNLTILVTAGLLFSLALGLRLPVGSFGVSVVNDPQGRPYLVIDHPSTHGWLLAYDSRHHRVETYAGTILLQ